MVTGYYLDNGSSPVFTGVPAHELPPQYLIKHARPTSAFSKPFSREMVQRATVNAAPVGTFTGQLLYILVEFTDRTSTYTEADFATIITGKIADYYSKASYGNVTLNPANETFGTSNNGVVGWLNVGYAHPNTGQATGAANQKLAKDAIEAADPFVNYAAYDTDGSGVVEPDELAIVIIAAGYEASISGSPIPKVWGHAWNMPSAPTVDGKSITNYGMFGEIHDGSNLTAHIATVGIQVHELGHLIFDLPDLYDTDSSSLGIGNWGLMGGGTWGNKTGEEIGSTPVLPCAWSKLKLGWVDGTAGTGTTSITDAGSTSANAANSVYRATTSKSGEYFLTENRQNSGYDQGLQRWLGSSFTGGVLIWHIDDNLTTNSDENHRWVDLEAADGTIGNPPDGANDTDPWYSGNKTTFNDTSTPNSRLYSGASSNVSISNISTPSNEMTAVWSSSTQPSTNADLIMDFGPGIGLYGLLDLTTWVLLHNLSPELITTGNLNGNGTDDLIMDFGSGVGLYGLLDLTTWVLFHNFSPELITTGNLNGK